MHLQLLTALLIVAGPAEDRAKKDEANIQGTWKVVYREFVGKKTPEAELKKWPNMVIKGGKMTVDDGNKKEVIPYKLDPSQSPKAIDLANTGPMGKETTRAIYELDGDTLKLCWCEKVNERPNTFTGGPCSTLTIMVLKRVKK